MSKAQDWKTTGCDGIQHFSLKSFPTDQIHIKITLIYQWGNRRRHRMAERRNYLFATKIRRQQVSQDLPTHHGLNNHVQDHKWNSHKNLHNSGRGELSTSRAKRMSPWK